jgi:hypothetical protein
MESQKKAKEDRKQRNTGYSDISSTMEIWLQTIELPDIWAKQGSSTVYEIKTKSEKLAPYV